MLILAGSIGYSEARFERRCPNGLLGTSPNFDFFAANPTSAVGVESKFLEPLRSPTVGFSGRYASAISTNAEPVWRQMYESLLADPRRSNYLDAAQLVKHYLGLRHSFRTDARQKKLVYLYWEPTNADSILEFVSHRREISAFSAEVADSEVMFIPLSYPQLWEAWLAESRWEGMEAHVDALRHRYAFEV